MKLTQASEAAEFWTAFVCKSLGVPDSFFKEITPEKQIEFFSLQEGLIRSESTESDVICSFLDRENFQSYPIFRHDDNEYISLTRMSLIMLAFGREIPFSEVLGWFGWGRCLMCRFFKKDEWSDDVGWIGFCKSPSDFTREALFQTFGCVHYEFKENA